MKTYRKYFIGLILCLVIITIIGCKKLNINKNNGESENNKIIQKKFFVSEFTKLDIPDEVYSKMIGNSIPNKDLVDRSNLSYLKITYYGFDEKSHLGEIIVNKEVASEVLDIFKELYEKKYPIEKMNLIDKYNADDNKAMKDNNTSAFCYIYIDGLNVMSNHSKGFAIDVNPLINPMVKNGVVSPKEGKKYLNRNSSTKGIIMKNDVCYNAFIKRGWTWGGDWNSPKDYQHFEKQKSIEKVK